MKGTGCNCRSRLRGAKGRSERTTRASPRRALSPSRAAFALKPPVGLNELKRRPSRPRSLLSTAGSTEGAERQRNSAQTEGKYQHPSEDGRFSAGEPGEGLLSLPSQRWEGPRPPSRMKATCSSIIRPRRPRFPPQRSPPAGPPAKAGPLEPGAAPASEASGSCTQGPRGCQ